MSDHPAGAGLLLRARKTIPVLFTPTEQLDRHPLFRETGNNDSDMEISSPKVCSMHSKRIQDIELMLTQEAALSPKKPEVRYLISAIWWSSWRCASDDEPTAFDSPIDNWPLVTSQRQEYNYETQFFEVKAGAQLDGDYVSLSANVWNALHSW